MCVRRTACSRLALIAVAVAAAMLGPAAQVGAQLVDPFLCYKATRARGAAKFEPIASLALVDRFESGGFDVKKPMELCLPADVDGQPAVDATTHLEAYLIKPEKGAPRHQRLRDFRVVTDLGELFLSTVKADRLRVPTAKGAPQPPSGPPDPDSHGVDHFKCYKVKKPKGFQTVAGVSVFDQLAQAKLYDLKKPTRLCAPVDKAGEGIKEEDSFLVCYQAKPAQGEPKHVAVADIFLENQLGREQLDTKVEAELCMPTLAVQGCGDGLVNEPGEECDDGNKDDGDGCSSACAAELPFSLSIVNINILQNVTAGDPGFDDIDDRLILLADEIAAADPDIVTMQEVVLSFAAMQLAADLLARHGLEYFVAQYGFVSGNAVLARWPASAAETSLLPDADLDPDFPDRRFAGRIVLASPVGPIDVYPMHLCAFCSAAERTRQTEAFLAFVDATHTSGHPALIGADFNAHTGTGPDQNPANDPPIDAMQSAGWVSLFDGFDAPCDPPVDRSGCTSGLDDLTLPDDTTTRRIDNIMIAPAAVPAFSPAISAASETGPTARFAGSPLADPNPECHFAPRIACADDVDCPAGAACNRNDFCVRETSISCAVDGDCPGDLGPETCRTTLWVSDHVGVRSGVELTRLP